MGEQSVNDKTDDAALRDFVKVMLDDVHALEQVIERGMIEAGVRRIGAEQEMFLIDPTFAAAPIATEVLGHTQDDRFTTELALFNLEANLSPQDYGGDCLRRMETELNTLVSEARSLADRCGAGVVLTGILPTIRRADLGLDRMTPMPRYFALNRAMQRMRGSAFHVLIKGKDELEMTHDNVMLEACNTSFQVHFQVGADEFASLYNAAQAITGPVLAAAVNSPVLLGKRLWHETRVALFQRSVDTRTTANIARNARPRVSFGERWVERSVLDIFREDIARFRVVLATDHDEDALALVAKGVAPQLHALRMHNGTVYRWNRACYGVAGGVPHLRIENRVLPSGPTTLDAMANSALFFGLMSSLIGEYGEVSEVMEFDDAKANFNAAAQHGLEASFTWMKGREVKARDLLLHELIPLARQGLASAEIDGADIDRYMGVLEERVKSGQTGARWALSSLEGMRESAPPDAQARALVAAMVDNQVSGQPVHTWPLAEIETTKDVRENFMRVGQFMRSNPFTVHPEDLVDLAANLMDWERIRHIPVEDDEGHLVGLLTHRALLRLVARRRPGDTTERVAVRDIMATDLVTVEPETPTLSALELMRQHRVSCVPVVSDDQLVGIITDQDLIAVSARLLDAYLRGEG
jgi:CBS domain-containing protein/gamma-glutamylcysteine synthetase